MNYTSELARWLDRAGEDPDLLQELRAVETDGRRSRTDSTAIWPLAPAVCGACWGRGPTA